MKVFLEIKILQREVVMAKYENVDNKETTTTTKPTETNTII